MTPALFTSRCSGPAQRATKASTDAGSARSSRLTSTRPCRSSPLCGQRFARPQRCRAPRASPRLRRRPAPWRCRCRCPRSRRSRWRAWLRGRRPDDLGRRRIESERCRRGGRATARCHPLRLRNSVRANNGFAEAGSGTAMIGADGDQRLQVLVGQQFSGGLAGLDRGKRLPNRLRLPWTYRSKAAHSPRSGRTRIESKTINAKVRVVWV